MSTLTRYLLVGLWGFAMAVLSEVATDMGINLIRKKTMKGAIV